jgi:hypothetical protein
MAVFVSEGIVGTVAIIWKHGFSQSISLAIAVAIIFLSMVWLGTTLRLGPPTRQKFQLHVSLFLILTGIDQLIPLFR